MKNDEVISSCPGCVALYNPLSFERLPKCNNGQQGIVYVDQGELYFDMYRNCTCRPEGERFTIVARFKMVGERK